MPPASSPSATEDTGLSPHQPPRHPPHPTVELRDALDACRDWPEPTCIISDGPYGLGLFPGEAPTDEHLAAWYEPHVRAWSQRATAQTTLWFWNTEVGWATVHPVLIRYGWEYQELTVWDKGLAHVAGNVNSKTIQGLPVTTEVCARYVYRPALRTGDGLQLSVKAWLRHEWERSGLPQRHANIACGVANAASRKYLTTCHRWYLPPAEHLVAMARHCAQHGAPLEVPAFSLDGAGLPTLEQCRRLRPVWNHTHGLTNVWQVPAVRGAERIKGAKGALHATQKPLELMRRQIRASSDVGDVIWEPFGGLCSASVAALELGRRPYAAEHNPDYAQAAQERLNLTAQLNPGRKKPTGPDEAGGKVSKR